MLARPPYGGLAVLVVLYSILFLYLYFEYVKSRYARPVAWCYALLPLFIRRNNTRLLRSLRVVAF